MTAVSQPTAPVRPLTRRGSWSRRAPLLPALGFTLVLTQIPFALTIWYSLRNWNLLSPGRKGFAGLANYRATFTDDTFWKAIWNTVILTGGATIASVVVGLVLAMLLQKKFPGRGVARTLAITPFFVMPVAVALFWRSAMFDPSFGLLGWLTDLVGLPRVNWLSEQSMLSIIMITSWRWTPFAMLVLLAGLQALPEDQLEAARVDGAGWWWQLRGVVLPHLRPFLELTALLLSMNIIQTFGEIALLTAGGPAFGTTNITYYVYLRAFSSFDWGTASAYGLVALVLTIALAMPALRLLSGIFQQEGRR
ncbi:MULTISPECIES: carbohydrate ABC transporter permease [unclassified Pseudofrankia]|uniref:carbohydrate ABC transporter permease n=1 Tax=unclassified Pseudofrankia TaxID=2994372 RepID=UPI0008DAA4BA|nr:MULTISPECIES: sugar ABC transporter permease [unclassified Pseudofrankia]MDT3442287.1 sugar ABC transporter permease [Pseudofrankia sp. BMG5.37]OHV60253.1 sugar ABC transporter permease [Pseudofrankia sp. BMG5.36]